MAKPTALITGGTSGIGKDCVRLFADKGYRVFYSARNRDKLEKTQTEFASESLDATGLFCDLSQMNEIVQLAWFIEQSTKKLDALVHCAAVFSKSKLPDLSLKDWDEAFTVNVTAPVFLTKELIGLLKNSPNAAVVNVSSIAGRFRSISSGVEYTASKAALIGVTKHLAAELGPMGIRINVVCPSQTKTKMLTEALSFEEQKHLAAQNPMLRLAEVREQSSVILFLCSKDSSYMNGAVIDVNGGQL